MDNSGLYEELFKAQRELLKARQQLRAQSDTPEDTETQRLLKENKKILRINELRSRERWARRGTVFFGTLAMLSFLVWIWLPNNDKWGATGFLLLAPTIACGITWVACNEYRIKAERAQ